MPVGSDASAASGRYSELSEWQRSIKSRISVSPKILTGTATGERADCRRWREEGGERVAAVDRWQGALSPKPDVGHRNRDVLGKEKPPTFVGGFVFALPIFTASHPATIVGVRVLNFCVRDGNRWTHTTINTNSLLEEVFPFLYSADLRGFLLLATYSAFFTELVTHTGFEPMLTA